MHIMHKQNELETGHITWLHIIEGEAETKGSLLLHVKQCLAIMSPW
jgi:hypothetical protein